MQDHSEFTKFGFFVLKIYHLATSIPTFLEANQVFHNNNNNNSEKRDISSRG
jgi:hypothetical protein